MAGDVNRALLSPHGGGGPRAWLGLVPVRAVSKTVTIFGRPLRIHGSEVDDYYRQLPDGGELLDPVLAGIRPFVREDAVCLDIGANIGLYTLALAALARDGKVWAFEPAPGSYDFLNQNIAINHMDNVEAFNVAVAATAGTVDFHDIPFFTAGSFAVEGDSFLTSEVLGSSFFRAPSVTVDQFVAEHELTRLDLVKIDVEGGELSVLEGATGSLTRHRPVVVLEFNSFGFSLHNAVLPQVALGRIQELFPYVFVIDRIDGSLSRLTTAHEAYEFLYDNGIHGPVDNLLCCFDDLPVEKGYRRLPAHDSAAAAVARLRAMERTVSWRVTAPLRRARVRMDASPLKNGLARRLLSPVRSRDR